MRTLGTASAGRAGRTARGVRVSGLVIAITLGLAACTGSPDPGDSEWGAVETSDPTPMATVTRAPDLDPVAPEESSVAPRAVDGAADAKLVSMTAETVGDADTLTLTFADGAIPGYEVRYVDRLERGVDDVVSLDGTAVQTITLSSTAPGTEGSIAESVITNATFDLPTIRQVLLATNLGGTLVFGVGLSWQAPFTVSTMGDDLVITYPHGSP